MRFQPRDALGRRRLGPRRRTFRRRDRRLGEVDGSVQIAGERFLEVLHGDRGRRFLGRGRLLCLRLELQPFDRDLSGPGLLFGQARVDRFDIHRLELDLLSVDGSLILRVEPRTLEPRQFRFA